MKNNVYLVFSEKPERVSREEYHEWYVKHAQENIESPTFVSAQRYSVQANLAGKAVGNEQHLSLYAYEGDMSTWRTDLNQRIAEGDIHLPDWFKEIKFMSWQCSPEGGLLTPKTRP